MTKEEIKKRIELLDSEVCANEDENMLMEEEIEELYKELEKMK